MAESLNIDITRVIVNSIKAGSVIVDYSIVKSESDDIEMLELFMVQMFELGVIDLGGPIMSYKSEG